VSLGNVFFDIGHLSDPASFVEARKYYLKALEMKPDDVDVRTDLGLTYYFGQPSDPQRAITEYRKSLSLDPRHEPTLQNLASALISTGNREEAEKRIDELQQVNSSNPSLPNLRAQLAQSKNAAQE
jgi:Flp pilus assembly protein TadD